MRLYVSVWIVVCRSLCVHFGLMFAYNKIITILYTTAAANCAACLCVRSTFWCVCAQVWTKCWTRIFTCVITYTDRFNGWLPHRTAQISLHAMWLRTTHRNCLQTVSIQQLARELPVVSCERAKYAICSHQRTIYIHLPSEWRVNARILRILHPHT